MSKNPRFFSFDYLINSEFSEDDLYLLFECDSLLYSLIKEMHLACDEYSSFDLICKKIKKDKNWMNENHFKTKRKLENFIHQAELAVKNVYQYSETQAKIWVQCFMIKYGFPLHQKC